MAFDAGSLLSFLKLNIKGFSTGLGTATRQTKKFDSTIATSDKTLKGMSGTAAGLGKLMLTGLGFFVALKAVTSFTSAIGDSITMAADLEKSMANVATLVDTTVVNMDELTESVVNMTSEVLKSSEDLSAGLYQVFSAGITDSAEAMEVLRVSAIAATAGLSTTLTSVDAITTILNAYGLEAEKATEISDLMFQTVKLGKTTFDQLAVAIGTVISPAASVGIELDELFASLATLTKGGINTQAATVGLRATLLSVIKPTDSAKQAADRLGLEWTAASLKAKGLIQFIADLREATGGNSETIAELIPNVRAMNSVMALTGKQFEELISIQGQFEDRSGSTIEAFKKQEDTYRSQQVKLGLMVDEIQIKLGQVFIPALNAMLEGIMSLFDAVGEELDELNSKLDPLDARMRSLGESTRLPGQGIDLSTVKVNNFIQVLKDADIKLSDFLDRPPEEQAKFIKALGLPEELLPKTLKLPTLEITTETVDTQEKLKKFSEEQVELADELIKKSQELGRTERELFIQKTAALNEELVIRKILSPEGLINKERQALEAINNIRDALRNEENLKKDEQDRKDEERSQKEIDRANRVKDAKIRALDIFNRRFENAGMTQLEILNRDQDRILKREGLTGENKAQILKFFDEKRTSIASVEIEKRKILEDEALQKQFTTAETFATATGDLASNLNQILINTGKEGSKELFLITKVAAIANAIVSTAVGVTRALELGIPFGPPAAAIVAAAGAAQVGVIASTALAEGGLVTSPTNALIGEAGPEAVIPLDRGVAPIVEDSVKNVIDEEQRRPIINIINVDDPNRIRAIVADQQAKTSEQVILNVLGRRNNRTAIGQNSLPGVL